MFKFFSSFYLFLTLMSLLAIGAAIGTFLENDFGTNEARKLVYNSLWYEFVLFLTVVNLIAVMSKVKMYKKLFIYLFHFSFIIIFIGAGVTRYFGFEGNLDLSEGTSNNIVKAQDSNEVLELPFLVQLDKFEMKKYAGSSAPSEFSSFVTIIDKDTKFKAHIYMNNTLDYKGYRFFQTSYSKDETKSTLTVNKDPGKIPTYLGYFLLFLALVLNLFHKKSRFRILFKRVNKELVFSLFLFIPFCNIEANNDFSPYIQTYLDEHKNGSVEVSKSFSNLVVQSRMGRMKPLDTLNKEVLRKLSRVSTLMGMNANQVVLGIFTRPKIWKKIPIIFVKSPKIKKQINLNKNERLATFRSFFTKNGEYILEKDVANALAMKPFERGIYEKDLINVDERISIFFMSYKGSLLKLFPDPNDLNNRWVDFRYIWQILQDEEEQDLRRYTQSFMDAVYARDYKKANVKLKYIKEFQLKYGKSVYPSSLKLKTEIILNELSLFSKLSVSYVIFGFLLLMFAFISIFKRKLFTKKIYYFIFATSIILLITHTMALLLRWYVSGHAPLSDTYESLLYISFSAVLAGVVFLRKSLFALSSSFIIGAVFLLTAHLNTIDPEITNLVPVLKSFWLSVHVSVITASYGFLGIGAVLGAITLVLFTLKNQNLQKQINHITDINEIYLILGLTLLVIGNFLGAIWANESWGRYWGWDPKETWAYISIVIYAIVLHLRFIKAIYSTYLFACVSLLSFLSILMTYFGVNFYLSGKHSYASGDPVAIPIWVYIILSSILILIILAYLNKSNKNKTKEKMK